MGAFGGAVGAQRIAERSAKRKELLLELRHTNAAILLSFTTCNAALAFKSQFALPMSSRISELKQDIEVTAKQKLRAGDQLHVKLDLKKFPTPVIPLETLKNLLFSHMSAVGRELSAVSEMERSHVGLISAMGQRNAFVDRFASEEISQQLAPLIYLGLRQPNGRTDTTYPDLVNCILEYSNDLAYFSATLCEDLMKHGKKTVDAMKKQRFRFSQLPQVNNVDFSDARASGMLVPEKNYEKWLRGFITKNGLKDATEKFD